MLQADWTHGLANTVLTNYEKYLAVKRGGDYVMLLYIITYYISAQYNEIEHSFFRARPNTS